MTKIFSSKFFVPIILFFFSFISFGIFIPSLGLYSDDWIFLTIYQKFGHDGLTQYFQTNRPVWGWLYQLSLPIFGKSVILWHVFAMFAQLSCGLAFRKLYLLLWPDKKLSALIGSILFILFPGFTLLPISITFGHIYIVYLFFLLSTIFMIKATKIGKRQPLYIFLSLLFYLANLLMMEYFFCLSFIQPVLLWIFFSDNQRSIKDNLIRLVKFYWPWILLLIAVVVWRIFIFDYQTYNYGLETIELLKSNPSLGISKLVTDYLVDLFKTGLYVWIEPIQYLLGKKDQTTVFYASLILMSLGFFASVVLLHLFSKNKSGSESLSRFNGKGFLLSFFALSLAGCPFWITGLDVSLNGFSSRFALPFIFGSCLLLLSLLDLIRKPTVKLIIVSLIISFALGKNFLVTNSFRQEQILVSSYMNQMQERIPGMESGSFIISNELPFSYQTETSFSAMVDWFYTPHSNTNKLDHVLVFSKDREQVLLNPEFQFEYSNFKFKSILSKSISSVILFEYGVSPISYSSCFTILNPQNIEYYASIIPAQSANLVEYSSTSNIQNTTNNETAKLFEWFFPDKHTRPWCNNFQKISSLQDNADYQKIIENYNESLRPSYRPSYALEMLPYLNAFAHNKNWSKVTEILASVFEKSQNFVCTFLADYSSKNQNSEPDKQVLIQMKNEFLCE